MADRILNISPDNLLHIASYLTSYDVENSPSQEEPAPLLDSDTDSDEAGSYSDVDEDSEDDADRMERMYYDNEEMWDTDHDDYIERRYDRQGERVMRAQRSKTRRRERARAARERGTAAKKEARGVLAMAGVCRAWREKMCLPRSCANAVLWKQVFEKSFPKVGCQAVVAKGYFNMFQLMVRVEALRGEGKAQAQVTEVLMEGVRLEDVMVIMDFQYKKRFYSGVGKMDSEQIVRVCVPKLGDLCFTKKKKWWKEARDMAETKSRKRNHGGQQLYAYYGGFGAADDSEDEDSARLEDDCSELKWSEGTEARLSFPTADIYAALPVWVGDQPSSHNLYQIYHGKPKWRKATIVEGFGGLLGGGSCEYVGGDDEMQADLPGNKYLILYQDGDILVGSSDSRGPYSEEDLEGLKEEEGDNFSESLPEQLRKEDVLHFILGK